MTKYRTITSYEELETLLLSHFGKSHSVPFLHLKLNSLQQEKGKSIRSLASKVEIVYHDLSTALTEGRSMISSRIISDVIKTQALGIFIGEVISHIRTILKAKLVRALEEAVNVALEEEKAFENDQSSRNFNKKTRFYNNSNNNNKDNWRSHAYNPHYNNNGTSRNNKSYRSIENNTNIKREFNNVRLICAIAKSLIIVYQKAGN